VTLGAWIFLSVVLVLVVLNKPFRKFFLWAAAISAVCCGLFFGYGWVRDWRERRAMAREAAIQQKKQDDCEARLNAVGSRDAMENAFEKLANADLCRANPDITPEKAALLKPGETLGNAKTEAPSKNTLEQPTRKSVRPNTIEGTVTKDGVLYGESLPGGPGGQVLGKVKSGTHVRVIRLDSIYGNVQVRTPDGITGWLSSDEINY
jgi:hypothetical protein